MPESNMGESNMAEPEEPKSDQQSVRAPGPTDSASGPMGPRAEEFTAEISQLKLSGSSAQNEARALQLGIVGLVVPLVLAVIGILMVMSTSDAADQRAFASQTFWLGNIIVVVGAALFLRYSLGRYLRFWMIRLIHEQRAQTDRVVDAIERASAPLD